MNKQEIKKALKALKKWTVDRLDGVRKPLYYIKEVKDIKSIPSCVDLVDDFIASAIKFQKEDFNDLLEFLDGTNIPKENIDYKYFLITIRDNDFYDSLSILGDLFVMTLGYKFTSDRFDFDKFKTRLPDLVCSIFSICQDAPIDYVKKYLQIFYTPEEINDFINKYGMSSFGDYENPLFKDDPRFAESLHCCCNAESLVIKLAYNKENNEYIEEGSEWIVI